MVKKFFLLVCLVVGMISTINIQAAVLEPELTYNENATPLYNHNYTIWASEVSMNLAKTAAGYVRVEHMEKKTLIEQYNNNFQVLSKQYIADELPLFGGFYAGENHYFLVYGQENPTEDDTKEVIRVVKYDLNWNRLSCANLYGEDIYIPFDAGSLRMVEYGGYLYIRTCYEAYASSDGEHHQSNLSLQICISDMSFVSHEYILHREDGSSYTYYFSDWDTSHSFNQFITVDDAGHVITLDHGDANPRHAVLSVFYEKAGTDTFVMDSIKSNRVSMMKFGGSGKQNLTRASIGGLTCSSEKYFAVGTSINQQSSDWNNTVNRNAYISIVSRKDIQNAKAEIRWLTAYPEDGNYSASNPYIVKLDNDTFLVMWEEIAGHNEYRSLYQTGNMSYVFLDKTGTPVSQVYTVKSWLSDCAPIVVNGKAVWYESSREGIRFRQIDAKGNFNTVNVLTLEGDITVNTSVNFDGSVSLKWNKIMGADGYYIHRRIVKTDSRVVREITIDNPKQTTYIDQISYYTVGDICEYFVYAYNDKVWSKASNAEYVTLTGLDENFFYSAETPLKNGKKYTVGGLVYKYKKGKMTLTGKSKNFTSSVVKIPEKVLVKGKKYPVTAIAANVFANDNRITQVVIGKNVTSIGKNAFSNCDYLWEITIKSQKLKSKKIGKNVFKKPGGSFGKKVYVKLPKKKYKTYQKILKTRGIQSTGVEIKFKK